MPCTLLCQCNTCENTDQHSLQYDTDSSDEEENAWLLLTKIKTKLDKNREIIKVLFYDKIINKVYCILFLLSLTHLR